MAGPMFLRRTSGRGRRRARFTFAVFLTMVVVAYAGVPHVARLVESVGGYDPGHYEPKDLERGAWLQSTDGVTLVARVRWDTLVSVALFLLVAVVWLTLIPPGPARRPPHR
jgi:hypothetical protein